ncbi:MAG: hypothetical protein NW237_11195 [Cyanobacteriota bacterium]|nr:hypothetical protein [Cyanobacteriota bacterium]
MTQPIEQVLIEAEGRYLQPPELAQLKSYVTGWTERLHVYRALRDQEEVLVKQVLAQLQQEMMPLPPQVVGLCQRDLMLILRHSSLAMLLQNEAMLKERLVDWMEEHVRLYNLQSLYEKAFRSLQQSLKQQLSAGELELIRPYVTQAQVALLC